MPCLFRHILDRVQRNHVDEIGECALDTVVAPGDILPRHAYYQIGDLLRDAGATRSLPGLDPLLRDELTVPSDQCIGCHERINFTA